MGCDICKRSVSKLLPIEYALQLAHDFQSDHPPLVLALQEQFKLDS
jgi:hypothetical protein